MIKNKISGDLASLFSLLIICFLTFYFGENASAQEAPPGKDCLLYTSDAADE